MSFIFLAFGQKIYALEVSFFVGESSLVRSEKKVSLKVGMKVQSGDVIKTGKKSNIEISSKRGDKLKILENSTIKIGSAAAKDSEDVSIISGSLKASFVKLAKGSGRIYSPTTVCSVRGTQFTVSISESGDTRVDMTEGRLELKNPYGKTELDQNENAENPVGSELRKNVKSSPEDWKSKNDDEFSKNPKAKSEDYDRYLSTFKRRSDGASKKSVKLERKVKDAKSADDLKEIEDELDKTTEDARDDLILNENSEMNLKRLSDNFQSSDEASYETYKKLQEKSSHVAEEQRRIHDKLQDIREEYKKAYDEIMGRFRSDADDIKKRSTFTP